MTNAILTQDYLKSFLSYNPDNGLFTWLKKLGTRVTVGNIAGTLNSRGYIIIKINTRQYAAHRLAYLYINGVMPDNEIDHIDGIRSNNVFDNLRDATRLENSRNCKIYNNNTSGHVGVILDKASGKWRAEISIKGKCVSFGRFNTIEEACAVRNAKAKEIFGDFYRETSLAT